MNTEIQSDLIRIESVIILDSDNAGDIYMERLYPLWIEPVVFTIQGKYPIEKKLRERTIEELGTNKNLKIVAFGADSEKFVTASEKRLSLASLFIQDLTMYFWQEPVFEFNEQRIVKLIQEFCQSNDLNRLISYQNMFHSYKQSSIKWYHSLIV